VAVRARAVHALPGVAGRVRVHVDADDDHHRRRQVRRRLLLAPPAHADQDEPGECSSVWPWGQCYDDSCRRIHRR
jgi:hypothetical protein